MTYPELKIPKRGCWKHDKSSWFNKPIPERLAICDNCRRKGCTWWWDTIEEGILTNDEHC